MNAEYLLLSIFNKPMLNLAEVCGIVGVEVTTAHVMRSKGTFPIPMRGKSGTCLMADVRDVAIYMDEARKTAT